MCQHDNFSTVRSFCLGDFAQEFAIISDLYTFTKTLPIRRSSFWRYIMELTHVWIQGSFWFPVKWIEKSKCFTFFFWSALDCNIQGKLFVLQNCLLSHPHNYLLHDADVAIIVCMIPVFFMTDWKPSFPQTLWSFQFSYLAIHNG